MKFKTFGTLLLVLSWLFWCQPILFKSNLSAAAGSQLSAGVSGAIVHIDSLEAELSKLQVANSVQQQFDSTANLLRLVYASQANLGQLPSTA